jgi:hypothetical protein
MLLMVVVRRSIYIPLLMTGGAPVTTAGDVPMGAGTIMPWRDPGGGGTKTPKGPIGRVPIVTPKRASDIEMLIPRGGGLNST